VKIDPDAGHAFENPDISRDTGAQAFVRLQICRQGQSLYLCGLPRHGLRPCRSHETFVKPLPCGRKEFPLARRYYSGYYARIFKS